MKAILFEEFGQLPTLRSVTDPSPAHDGVVIEVAATGLCRSDWHAWKGHDPDVRLPHVGGHELAGTVVSVGQEVRHPWMGRRVTVPFVCGCGTCMQCATGNHQVCERQRQPGFSHWGSFAQYVRIDHADANLVPLPESIASPAAASLGCRFGTAFRAVVRQGKVGAGDWVAVHGCGGTGLSAVMVAVASGARVVAVDVSSAALNFARDLGAAVTVDASTVDDVGAAVIDLTDGGAQVSLDCLGDPRTCEASVRSLARRGRHVQVGLLPAGEAAAALPMDRVVARELEIVGSHGIQAHEYPAILEMVEAGRLRPERLLRRTIGLPEIPAALTEMDIPVPGSPGLTIVDPAR
ncbi:zinc-dependent alcohol dehydrogenase family protein [Streptomyces albidus (ex Kaewkla and Franco 2022)]|uniref:zinc-dependent alcohol dehydrogenase family protein n=1 Tax=Streptomyces albidus (ex Kaewkla and Franco 2022) TaxID=722709 RepID=UPI0015EFA35E|nr:zinc-dependent alcohol dehydrogenase family protein [Streptomyces albidus (ex Kaewkla and Franco 2022)]